MKSDFRNLVKTPNPNINFINNSYSNIQQFTDDNSNINSVNYANLFNNQRTNNITPDSSNINYNLFRNNNFNETENNSFENTNNSIISSNFKQNVIVKSSSNNQGVIVNAKPAIQNMGKFYFLFNFS